jgi:hypothetical protein
MFGYSVVVAQYLEEKRKPISDGYYFINENECCITKAKPNGKIIGLKELEDILFVGFKNSLLDFVNSEENHDVYCLALYTSEHNDLLMHINNESSYQDSLENYIKKYPKYKDKNNAQSLKMSLGDFKFSYDCMDGLSGQALEVMKLFNALNYFINVDDQLFVEDIKDFSFYFDGAIFNNALYSLIDKVLNRLKAELSGVNKTDKFVCYPSCGDDYIDLNILIRRHCDKKLFYELYENMKEADSVFNNYVKTLDGASNRDLFHILCEECLKNTHRTNDIFSKTLRNEYVAINILEERLTVNDSIEILKDLLKQASIENNKEINTKIFLIGCVIINQSCHNEIPVEKIKQLMTELESKNADLKEIICYLEAIK